MKVLLIYYIQHVIESPVCEDGALLFIIKSLSLQRQSVFTMIIENIIRTFCESRCISEEDIAVGNNRRIHDTRYMIWVYLHCEMGISANQIAKRFGRNRPSVFRGIRIVKHHFKYHKELREEYQSIVKKIEGMT